ncbi:hypothetical protein L1274_006398 [Duganella sp. HSC-15S17]|uniref:Uncharacterized protein n=1 Tax=Duganella violaceipulchra TaxID=2849652 RepID=A0ABT1GUG8_9BURK|nr:hypothetical protein [Duganella violaceicalia]
MPGKETKANKADVIAHTSQLLFTIFPDAASSISDADIHNA